jgi:hypothetical protein
VLLFFPSDTRVRQNLGLNFYSILDYEGNTYGIPFACVGEFVLILLQFVSVFTLNNQDIKSNQGLNPRLIEILSTSILKTPVPRLPRAFHAALEPSPTEIITLTP